MKKLVLVMSVVMLALSASSLVAAGFGVEPWIQAMTSKAALRSYLIERSVIGYSDTYGEGVLDQNNDSFFAQGVDAFDLAAKLSQTVSFCVVNGREDRVNQTVQLYDKDYNLSFFGWKALALVSQPDGGITAPKLKMTLQMPDRVAIEVPADVRWVYVRTYSEEGGQVGGVSCTISERNGRRYLDFPIDAVGDAFAPGYYGELEVQRETEDGYVTSLYTLTTGLPVTTTGVSMEMISTIEGAKLLASNSNVIEVIPSVDGVGMNTLFGLTMTEEMGITIRGKTSEGEEAIGCFVKVLDGEGASSLTYIALPAPYITLPAGRYHIWFAWSNFHEPDERGPGWEWND